MTDKNLEYIFYMYIYIYLYADSIDCAKNAFLFLSLKFLGTAVRIMLRKSSDKIRSYTFQGSNTLR